jgi:hypothetical protein
MPTLLEFSKVNPGLTLRLARVVVFAFSVVSVLRYEVRNSEKRRIRIIEIDPVRKMARINLKKVVVFISM